MNLSTLVPYSLQFILGFLDTLAVIFVVSGGRQGRWIAFLMLAVGVGSTGLLLSSPEFSPNWVLILLGIALGVVGGWASIRK